MPNNGNSDSREVSANRGREERNCITHRRLEAPSTPGRPFFSFNSIGNLSRKSFPSKWDDAEKWLISSHHSPPHTIKFSEPSNLKTHPDTGSFQGSASLDHHDSVHASNGISCSTHTVLKDKFTDSSVPIFPNLQYSEPNGEGFLFGDKAGEVMKDACSEVVRKDVGTEMTPLGSCTTSRCHTPFKSSSPARHNTPASKSGPLSLANHDNTTCTIDLIQLEECHFAKLQVGKQYNSVTSHWRSREEEEEEISKSLRHNASQKADSDCRAATWEEEERTKSCLRYKREEAKIQAWLDLQSAKAEEQSRKLEVKIQKMRSNLEEKLMKRMAVVHRKAEEWKAAAKQQHLEQIQKTTEQAQKIKNQYTSLVLGQNSCGCFPCTINHH
ncbi:unnamed protein product [Sphenostylis stenocarpa]|uniref:Remorin C-terminal domain-containing protein n=1 Tax=Sphenostylis stenocarpa TaxID=92480 RepID=A0AA86TFW5_9FABA|nr:unnamed protein product [Sphenostylis stenocarpa]